MLTPPPGSARLPPSEAGSSLPSRDLSILLQIEVFWRDHQKWLEEKGYMLRPRYRVGWVPEWKGKDVSMYDYDDSLPMTKGHLLDATRISTGELVMLKRISKRDHPTEIDITRFFATEPRVSHPRNHCVPLDEVLDIPDDPDGAILVIPLLRSFNNPPMETVGEAVEFFRQFFEGMQFVHQSNVAHRDCMNRNIMMDPRSMYPKMFHPRLPYLSYDFKGKSKYFSRTARPTKYYIIDFGLSLMFDPEDGPALAPPIEGGDRTVPEFQDPSGWYLRDPYPADVYYIGNMIRKDFFQKVRGLEFVQPLVNDMVQDDPTKRPKMDEVVERFGKIRNKLSWWSLTRRLIPRKEDSYTRVFTSISHFFRTIGNTIALRSALPTPKS